MNAILSNVGSLTGTIFPSVPKLQEVTVKSNTSGAQTVTPETGYDGFSQVTVGAIDLQAKTVTLGNSEQVIEPDSGKDGLSSVTVPAVALQDKTVTPTSSQQTITADSGYNGLGTVTVGASTDRLNDAFDTGVQNVILSGSGNFSLKLQNVVANGYGYIASRVFSDNTAIQSFSAPDATEVGNYTFTVCSNLSSVSFPKVTTIGINALSQTAITSLSLPEATTIGSYLCNKCSNLISASLPKFQGSIGASYMFAECSNLTTVNLPELLTLSNYSFMKCYALASINLPKCTKIGTNVFFSCTSLHDVYLGADSMCVLDNVNAFSGSAIDTDGTARIHVPADLEATYKADSVWSTYASKIVGDYVV